MKIIDLTEARQGSLFNSMNLEYAAPALRNNCMMGTSLQKFGQNGRVIADPDFKHNLYKDPKKVLADPTVSDEIKQDVIAWRDAVWHNGVSLTRSFDFAIKWKSVTFELDYAKLSHNYKIIPWNWGSSKNRYKKELEEFVDLGVAKDTKFHISMPSENVPKLQPLDRYLLGIYINKGTYDIYTNSGKKSNSDIDLIMAHPLYKGIHDE